MNLNNSNGTFQDFSKCDYNLHWSYSNFFRHLIVVNQLSSNTKVIELGAADSNYEAYAKENFGMDIHITKYDAMPGYQGVIELDITKGLVEEDNTVDIVIFTEVVEHLPRDKVMFVLEEILRVLKPGGKLIISTPTPNKPKVNLIYPSDHDYEYSYKEFTHLVSILFRIDKEIPWAVTEYNKRDNTELFCKLDGAFPEGMVRAVMGILCEPEEAKQLTFICSKVRT